FDRVELQIDCHLTALFGQLVVDPHLQAGIHPRHDIIEIVTVDLDELAISQWTQRRGRIAGKIAHDAYDKWKFALDLSAFGFDFVGNVHPWLADAIELVVDACTHGMASPSL